MSPGLRFLIAVICRHLAANWSAVVVGILYSQVTLVVFIPEQNWDRVLLWLVGINVIPTLIVTSTLVAVALRPYRALNADAAGTLSDAERSAACRRVLALPFYFSAIALSAWLLSAATLPLTFPATTASQRIVNVHAVSAMCVIGFIAFISELYILEHYCAGKVLPRLLAGTPATRIAGARTPSLGLRMSLLLASTCAVPVTVLTVTTLYGAVDARGTAFLGAIFLALGAMQWFFIARTLGNRVATLDDAMVRIRRDDLDAHVPVLSTDALGKLGEGFNEMAAGLRRGRYVKETFGRYVAPQVVEEILRGKIALGGEDRFVTVLFSDIRGFTAMSEELPPAEVVRFLNQFLDRMVEVLVRHGATIDKFIGDAVMATFGAPIARTPEEDARAAVQAAVDMVAALEAWNVERTARGEAALKMGIGLHSGVVVAGNIGSARKTEYTVIGDTVNTASRIEAQTKALNASVLISEQTRRLLGDGFSLKELPPVEVKGKREPLRLYEVKAR